MLGKLCIPLSISMLAITSVAYAGVISPASEGGLGSSAGRLNFRRAAVPR